MKFFSEVNVASPVSTLDELVEKARELNFMTTIATKMFKELRALRELDIFAECMSKMSERQKIRKASNVDLTLIRKLIYFANIPSVELILNLRLILLSFSQ